MKNFDVEQLERKNIYETPEGLFRDVQKNVLGQIADNKVIPIAAPKKSVTKWWYAAAAVMMLFGLIFLFKYNADSTRESIATESAPAPAGRTVSANIETSPEIKSDAPTAVLQAEKTYRDNLTKHKNSYQTSNTAGQGEDTRVAGIEKVKPEPAVISDAQITEEIITTLSPDDLADLAKTAEGDVYLDLYY